MFLQCLKAGFVYCLPICTGPKGELLVRILLQYMHIGLRKFQNATEHPRQKKLSI